MNVLVEKLAGFLKKLFPTRVLFEDGSYIEFLNREAILYVESSGHQMEIAWYFQRGHIKGRVLDPSNINYWDSPFEHEALSIEKKAEIQRKIMEYSKKRPPPSKLRIQTRDPRK